MRWQLKPDQGTHHLRRADATLAVKRGQIVDDKDWPIPEGMLPDFTPLDPLSAKVLPPVQDKYRLAPRTGKGSKGKFDVVPVEGETPINTEPMDKETAEKLLADLNG